jgi:carbon storage regulator
MLVLTRKVDEKIIIGNDIVLTVVKIEGSRVRLGIEAPSDVAVFREEIAPRVAMDGPVGVVHRSGKDGAKRLLAVTADRIGDG